MIPAAICNEDAVWLNAEEIFDPPVIFEESSGPPHIFMRPPTFKSGIADMAEAETFNPNAILSERVALSCKAKASFSLSEIFLMSL